MSRGCLLGVGGFGGTIFVLVSHGGEAVMVSNGFEVVAKSEQRAVVAVEYDGGRFYGTLSGTSVMCEDIQALYHDGYNKLRSQTDSSLELYEVPIY
ncbi:GMP synthase [Tanacetum coccineum]